MFDPMRLASTIATIIVAATLTTAAAAVTVTVAVPGLFNSGVDNNKVTLGNNATDPHWRLIAAPAGVTLGNAYTGVRNAAFPIGPWMVNDTNSRWLTPTINHTSIAAGEYTYELQFTLTPKLIASTGMFTARYAVDNSMVSVMLNSTALTAPAGSFTAWTNFSASSGFVAGLNKLTFKTRNAVGSGNNPTGLRVEFLTSSIEALPEPGSWALMIAGFGLVGAAQRRKRALVTG